MLIDAPKFSGPLFAIARRSARSDFEIARSSGPIISNFVIAILGSAGFYCSPPSSIQKKHDR
jgi:hypothetical protein